MTKWAASNLGSPKCGQGEEAEPESPIGKVSLGANWNGPQNYRDSSKTEWLIWIWRIWTIWFEASSWNYSVINKRKLDLNPETGLDFCWSNLGQADQKIADLGKTINLLALVKLRLKNVIKYEKHQTGLPTFDSNLPGY